MKTGTFFIRIWRIVSILGFLFALFSSYISYPEKIAVRFDEFNRPTQFIDREVLFYLAVGLFIVNYFLLKAIARLFLRVPTAQIPIINKTRWAAHRPELNEIFTNWFSSLSSAIITVLGLGLLVISFLNRGDRRIQSLDYAWLLPTTAVILIAVLVSLPIRLSRKPSEDV